jgi:hypothetical protein
MQRVTLVCRDEYVDGAVLYQNGEALPNWVNQEVFKWTPTRRPLPLPLPVIPYVKTLHKGEFDHHATRTIKKVLGTTQTKLGCLNRAA